MTQTSGTSGTHSSHAELPGQPLGIAIVGAGMVAELHREAIVALPTRWQLRGVVERDPERAMRRAEEWATRQYSDLDEMIADERVDAVLVLTPYEHHEAVALAALTAGKHVLVEKPVGSLATVARLAAAAEQSGTVCMPGHNYAYQTEFQQLRRLVRAGSLGTIRAMWITYAIAHPESVAAHYDGVLDEVMVHHAYLTLATLGIPQRIWAGRLRPGWREHGVDDQAWMTWEYDGFATAHLFASFAVGDESADPWTFVVKVLGTEGAASYTWRSMTYRRPIGSLPMALPAYEESYAHELSAFAEAISGRADAIVSPLSDAARVAQLLSLAQALADNPPGEITLDSLFDV